jgi:hypothetical protein
MKIKLPEIRRRRKYVFGTVPDLQLLQFVRFRKNIDSLFLFDVSDPIALTTFFATNFNASAYIGN